MQAIIRWIRNHPAQMTALIFWLLVILGTHYYINANGTSLGELASQLRDFMTGTWYAPLLYTVIYILRPLTLLPASWLTVLAGNVWGLGTGFAYSWVGGVLSALIPYFIGRWFTEDSPSTVIDQTDDDRTASLLRRFARLAQANPFQAVLTTRLLYLPYDLVNLVMGGLKIAISIFMAATFAGNLPATFAFVGVGASIEGDISSGTVELDARILAVSGLILVVSLGVSHYLNQRTHHNVESEQS